MRVIRRHWYEVSRADEFRLYPIGDVHIGLITCDEKMLRARVKEIEADPQGYWIGLGDYCDYISRKDKRYDPNSIAPWCRNRADIAGAQTSRFLDIIKPIAGKCLGLLEGNHEAAIWLRYERPVYADIVMAIKQWSDTPPEDHLGLGFTGWLILQFCRDEGNRRQTSIKISLHHGFVGGRLMGAKALNMERWLWSHECDLCLMGHSHVIETQWATVQRPRGSKVVEEVRKGAFCGAFVGTSSDTDTYAERKGYFPNAPGGIMVTLRPGAMDQTDRVRLQV